MAPRTPPARLRALRTLLAATVLTSASLTTGTAHAAPSPAPESSRGYNDPMCVPSTAHPRPVVLVHGTGSNSVANFAFLAPYLVRRGYCVYALDYGQMGVPGVGGLAPIEESAQELDTFVESVRVMTGAREVDIVGHSQGGVMPRYYLRFLGGASKVHHFIGIAAPNHGTTEQGLVNVIRAAGLEGLVSAVMPSMPQQYVGSAFLTKLNRGGDTVPGVHYTVIATRYDEVSTPYTTAFLDGPDVRNILIQDLCPADLSLHGALGITDRIAHHLIDNILDPAPDTPTTCASASLL